MRRAAVLGAARQCGHRGSGRRRAAASEVPSGEYRGAAWDLRLTTPTLPQAARRRGGLTKLPATVAAPEVGGAGGARRRSPGLRHDPSPVRRGDESPDHLATPAAWYSDACAVRPGIFISYAPVSGIDAQTGSANARWIRCAAWEQFMTLILNRTVKPIPTTTQNIVQ